MGKKLIMINIDNLIVKPNISMKDVLKIIDSGKKQIALVVDNNKKLIGTVNDGDIRRALLKGVNLDETIENIYFKSPTVAKISDTKESILKMATIKKVHQVPIVNEEGIIVGLDIMDELIGQKEKSNRVILMVGGLGTRLRPLTENIPKPMLKVGDKPILETIIESFSSYGFINITLCVNYKSNIIKEYFGDGSKFGVKIDYVLEEVRMGTAGALGLLKSKPKDEVIVMNGDLLTSVNFDHLLDFHNENDALATMCVRKYDIQVPYGVVNIKNNKILSIKEKPMYDFFVNAGIYILSPSVISMIQEGEYYDMPMLFEELIKEKSKVCSFPIREYWLDIGRIEEYEKANNEYNKVF